MPARNKNIKRNVRRKRTKQLVSNVSMGILLIIVIGFIISGVDRIFFNQGFITEPIDLSSLIITTQYEKKTGHKIQVEILNGCGIPKLARMYTNYLRSEGIDVMDSRNADDFNYIETKILHHRGEIEAAWELANILMIDKNRIIEDNNENLFFDLTIIIGKDYSNLPSYSKALFHQQPF